MFPDKIIHKKGKKAGDAIYIQTQQITKRNKNLKVTEFFHVSKPNVCLLNKKN